MTLVLDRIVILLRWVIAALAGAALAACGVDEAASDGAGDETAENSEIALTIRTAQTEMRDGNLTEAGRLLDDARAEDPENPAIWVATSRLRFRGGEHLSAIEAADRALELGPGHAPALLMRAQLVRDSNGLSESLPWFEAAVQADPDLAEAVGEYAATLGDLGRNKDMLQAARNLAEIDPENGQVFYLQAVLAARADEPVLARSLLSRSGWRDSGIPAAMMLDAIIDLKQGNYDTASETLDQLAARQPGNTRVRDLYARALWQSGRDEKLIAEMTPLAELPDASRYLIMLVGRAHERLGNRAKAAPLIAKAYDAPKTGWSVLAQMGFTAGDLPPPTAQMRGLIAAGDLGGASGLAARLKQRFAGSSDILALAGDAALARGNAQPAMRDYAAAARVRRPWPLTRKIIEASKIAGDTEAADALLARYALGDPRNADAIAALMKRAAQKEDWERAASLADYAIALGAGQDPSVLSARIDAAKAIGDDDDSQMFAVLLQAVRPAKLVRE